MKKVLIIAYYFPPLGWSGVQRTLKFIKYLRDFDWEPIVVTVGKTKFSILDESLLEEVPEEIEVIRIDDVKFKGITDELKDRMREYIKYSFDIISDENLKNEYEKEIESAFEKLRSLFLLPDGNAVWANNVINEISKIVNLKDVDVVYTTSAPYSTHLIGHYLKVNYKLPWACDFRDEWSNNPYFSLNKDLRHKIEKNVEEQILLTSNKIITISNIAKGNYINDFKIDANKIEVITNGYDEEDFKEINENRENKKFIITYNGSFYSSINPYTFITAINKSIENNIINKSDIELQFIGKIDNEIKNKIINMDKFHIIIIKSYAIHQESLKLSSNSEVLLLITGQGDKVKSVYTGKVFEYLRLKKPILALSPKGSVVEELLSETKSGINVEYDDIEGIEKAILKYYNDWKHGKEFKVNEDEIKKYERKNLTKKLAEVFDELLEE